MTRAKHNRFWGLWRQNEGFTLGEVLVTIIIMGFMFAIASSTWFNVVEGRSVDSAANQLAADLRLAHSTATNRLAPQEVSLTAESSEYSMTGSASPRDLDNDPDGNIVTADTTVAIVFCPDGSAEEPPSSPACPGGSASTSSTGPPITVMVAPDGDAPSHEIEVIRATSRVEID